MRQMGCGSSVTEINISPHPIHSNRGDLYVIRHQQQKNSMAELRVLVTPTDSRISPPFIAQPYVLKSPSYTANAPIETIGYGTSLPNSRPESRHAPLAHQPSQPRIPA